jgi:hypothetical protein
MSGYDGCDDNDFLDRTINMSKVGINQYSYDNNYIENISDSESDYSIDNSKYSIDNSKYSDKPYKDNEDLYMNYRDRDYLNINNKDDALDSYQYEDSELYC